MSTASAGGIHYKIDTSTNFYADKDGKLAGMRMNWIYDPEVSAIIMEERDKSAAGLQQAAADILADLKEMGYFAEFSTNGELTALANVSQFSMKLTDQKSLQLGFQLPLVEAVDVNGKIFGLTLSDPYATADMTYSSVERAVLADELKEKCGKPELTSQDVDTGEHKLTIHTLMIACK